jgi:hypothetical protein
MNDKKIKELEDKIEQLKIDLNNLRSGDNLINTHGLFLGETGIRMRMILENRMFGKWANKSLWLNTDHYDFEIIEDSTGGDGDQKLLLVTKK